MRHGACARKVEAHLQRRDQGMTQESQSSAKAALM